MTKNIYNFSNKIIPYLYTLYLISLLISLAGMNFFAYLSFIFIFYIAIYEAIIYKKSIFENNLLNIFILLIFASFLFSILSSPYLFDPEVKIFKSLKKLNVFFFIPFNYLVLSRYYTYQKALKILYFALIPLSFYFLFQMFTGFNPKLNNYEINFGISKYITGFFSNYIYFSNTFTLYLLIILSVLINFKIKSKLKKYLIFISFSLIITVPFSGSRVAFISVLAGFLPYLFYNFSKKIIILLILFLGIFILSYKYNTHIKGKLNHTIENINMAGDELRYKMWQAHLYMFKENIIKGVGIWINVDKLELFYEKYKIGGRVYKGGHSHNNYVYVLSSSGLIGFLLFYSFWFYIFYILIHSVKLYNKRSKAYLKALTVGLLVAFISMFVNSLTEATFFVPIINHNLSFFVALSYVLYRKSLKLKNKEIKE